jgi:hypothetical protein
VPNTSINIIKLYTMTPGDNDQLHMHGELLVLRPESAIFTKFRGEFILSCYERRYALLRRCSVYCGLIICITVQCSLIWYDVL